MAGSPEARRTWLYLRGPYFAAYLLAILLAVTSRPVGPESYFWKAALGILGLTALVGSVTSFVVAGLGKVSPRLVRIETLEVTSLRMFVLVQVAYGFYVLSITTFPDRALYHLLLGAMAAGALQSLTWRTKVPRSSDAN